MLTFEIEYNECMRLYIENHPEMERYQNTQHAACISYYVDKLLNLISEDFMTYPDYYVLDWGSYRPTCKDCNKIPHQIDKEGLPFASAVYVFYWPDKNVFLKIGRVSAGSENRYYNQHYQKSGANSSLAKSIWESKTSSKYSYSKEFKKIPKASAKQKNPIGKWIVDNLERIDIIFPNDNRSFLSAAVESYFHAIFNPLFEGKIDRKDDENSIQKP